MNNEEAYLENLREEYNCKFWQYGGYREPTKRKEEYDYFEEDEDDEIH